VEEVELEIVMDELPDVPRVVEGLAEHLKLEPESLGMTSTLDRLVDTDDMALLSQDHSLRVRQKLQNIYAGNEIRLTYKQPLRDHERLMIRNEEKLKLTEPDYDLVLGMLANIALGVAGQRMKTMLTIEELAREANLGPVGEQVNISVDHCMYSLPGKEDEKKEEVVFEIESHGVPDELILKASDWVVKELGGRFARQCKYARGLRLFGKL
jgi:hypothetical protein